jgi:membrane associated rhomboid family serine protease
VTGVDYPPAIATCYRHPDRETGVACSRCGRPICPDCMTPTSVGMRCPECAGDRTEVRTARTLTTGRMQATYVLIGINVFVFVLQLLTGGPSGTDGRVFADGALCANAVGDGGICGGGGQVIQSTGGEWWRIITSGFLHGGLIHLALNMFVLFILGQVLEPAIGTVRFVAVYIVALIAGAVGALIMSDPFTFTVGASGAIYGLFIATIVIARQRGQMQVVQQLAFWLVINLVFTFAASNISVGGHLGGIVGGAIGALIVVAAERSVSRRETLTAELVTMAGLAILFFAAAVIVAQQGVTVTL